MVLGSGKLRFASLFCHSDHEQQSSIDIGSCSSILKVEASAATVAVELAVPVLLVL